MAGCGSVRLVVWCGLVVGVMFNTAAHNDLVSTIVSRLFQDVPALKLTLLNVRPDGLTSTQRSGRRTNTEVLPRLCYSELGCLETDRDFVHPQHRPYNMEPNSREQINAMFHVRSRQDPTGMVVRATDLTRVLTSSFRPDRQTKIIIHGFLNGRDMPWLKAVGDAYLKVQDVNVVYVDWTDGSLAIYSQAVANTRVAGLEVARFINWLKEHTGHSPSQVHLIGHSLGAHVAGYAGERVAKLDRITGLDPADPFFQFMPPSVRLDPTDAAFVDVVHTDAGPFTLSGGYGLLQPVGHVDFYPNGGEQQIGCEQQPAVPPLLSLFSNTNIQRGVEDSLGCNHMRAVTLFIDSITGTCPYLAFQCPSYSDFRRGKCFSCDGEEAGCASMGEEANLWAGSWHHSGVQLYLSTGPPSSLCLYHYKLRVTVGGGEAGCATRGALNITFLTPLYTGRFHLTRRKSFEVGKTYAFTLEYEHDLGESKAAMVTWNPRGADPPACRTNLNASLPITNLKLTNIEVSLYSRRQGGGSHQLQGSPSEITLCPSDNKSVAWVSSEEVLRMFRCSTTTINTATATASLVTTYFNHSSLAVNTHQYH